MPSERFLRLPAEKQEAIRRAAVEEYQRVKPEDASINRIIRAADISRGSFYTYFEDKDDLLYWIIGNSIDDHNRRMLELLEAADGDIWRMFEDAFDMTIDHTVSGGLIEIVMNMIRSGSANKYFMAGLTEDISCERDRGRLREHLYEKLDHSDCSLDYDHFGHLLDLWRGALMISLKAYFTKYLTREESYTLYQSYLMLLRYGAGKDAALEIPASGETL